jgi:hypothetical protein
MIGWTVSLLIGACPLVQAQPEPREQAGTPKEPPKAKADPGLSFYALPSISSDKNSGVTYGLLGALLRKDEEGRTDILLTATLAHQSLVGWNGDVNLHLYPSVSSEFEFDCVVAQRVLSEFKLSYKDLRFRDDFDLLLDFHELRSPTDRFFGRSEDAPHSDQSVYTSNAYRVAAAFGPRLSDEVALQGTARWRKFRVGPSLIKDLPQTLDRFPEEPGIEGGDVLGIGVTGIYDSRDVPTTPVRGALGRVYAEQAWYFSEGRSVPFWVLGAQWTQLIPLDRDAGFVSVINVQVQVSDGPRIPFWELSSLGGIATLRSFYQGRFTQKDMMLLNLEERIRILSLSVFGTSGEVQVAPFFDLGKVFDSLDDVVGSEALQHFHSSYGIGVRGVVPPSFLGRVDVAWGREGLGVTVGLDYPF